MDQIKDILRECGYPESVVVLDCESYFDGDFSLSKLKTYEYVTDDRFELLGWAVKTDDNECTRFLQELPPIDWKNVTVVMHNASFDALVLAVHHELFPPFIIDTLDLARHVEPRWANSLAALCERHGLPAKGETAQFKGLHKADFDLEMWQSLVEYATNDADREYDLLQLLLPKLSNPKFELEIARYTRDLFIRPVLNFSMDRANVLKTKMLAEVQRVIKQQGLTETQIRSNKFFESRLRGFLGSEEPPMKQGKKGPLLAIAKTDAGYEYLLNHPNEQVQRLMEARVAVKSWPLHIKRVTKLCSIFECAGKRLPNPLKYCGAHTGRWSGGGGINLQNLTARGHPLANEIRTLIEAPLGYVIYIVDFSQIEARILDWLAEQNDMLRAFAEDRQVYCEFASELVGHRIRKPKKTDNEIVAKWHGNYRQMGKVGILGAGYGMGADRCLNYARDTYGLGIDFAMAERIIKLYRRTHSMVVLFWKKVERAFRLAIQTAPQAYELTYGLRFFREDNVSIIQLPNARRLSYTNARVEGTTRYPQLVMPNPAAKFGSIPMWGGYLAENIVQAVSRDILAEAVLKVESLGLRIPLITHDDLCILIPESEIDTYCPRIDDIVRTPPSWAANLPVDIEGKISKEYCK